MEVQAYSQEGYRPYSDPAHPNVKFLYRDMLDPVPPSVCDITQRGKFYHKLECKWIKDRSAEEISTTELQWRELARCRTCYRSDASDAGSVSSLQKVD